MTGFHQISLGEILTLQRGFDITKSEQTDGEIPIVSSSGISSFHNKWKVKGPGVVIGRKGTLGTVHFIQSNYWPHDTTLWIKDFKGNDPRFLNYFLQTLKLENFDVGASNPTLNRNHVHKIKIIFPKKVETQKRIAATLSAYDELIENNQRRIALLEKMTEEIYREWFVRMRFPCHENAKFSKGLPADWDTKRVKEIVVRKGFGRIYREDELSDDGEVIVIGQSRADCLGYYDGEPQHMASPDSPIILFGDHSCKMVLMTKPFSLAENVIPFMPKPKVSPYFLFHLVKDLARTTEYKRHWTDLTNREVLVPKESLQVEFENVVKHNHEQIEVLQQAILKAEKVRNMLLPRLISGKLSVENLDIQFPPGMEEFAHEH